MFSNDEHAWKQVDADHVVHYPFGGNCIPVEAFENFVKLLHFRPSHASFEDGHAVVVGDEVHFDGLFGAVGEGHSLANCQAFVLCPRLHFSLRSMHVHVALHVACQADFETFVVCRGNQASQAAWLISYYVGDDEFFFVEAAFELGANRGLEFWVHGD